MGDPDVKIDLGAVEETLIIPLWARAKDAEKKHPIVDDTHAREIVAKIDYDFDKIESRYMENHQLVWSISVFDFSWMSDIDRLMESRRLLFTAV